ncbi:uncharacterized protein [Rutidosis leptorrhynchoides]|uniref:uncharacterized protein isoform X2 n=1 Tax=Rutidosis leptorrhynchoides TaxID=125765 RepID=UPI003A999312
MKEDEEAEKEVEEKDGNAPDETEGKETEDIEKDSADDKKDGTCKIPHVPLSDDVNEVFENNHGELILVAEQMSKTEAEKDGAVEGHNGNLKGVKKKKVEAEEEGAVENDCHVEGQ